MPPAIPRKRTGQVMLQGQTAADLYGNDPNVEGAPVIHEEPRELRP